jgi:hypothetical protein
MSMSDKAQLAALGLHLRAAPEDQPASLHMQALAALAGNFVCDPSAFARAILEGATPESALAADMRAALAPLTPEERAEADEAIRRMELRRSVIQAAAELRHARGEVLLIHVTTPDNYGAEFRALKALEQASEALDRAVDAFTDAGGMEAIG